MVCLSSGNQTLCFLFPLTFPWLVSLLTEMSRFWEKAVHRGDRNKDNAAQLLLRPVIIWLMCLAAREIFPIKLSQIIGKLRQSGSTAQTAR